MMFWPAPKKPEVLDIREWHKWYAWYFVWCTDGTLVCGETVMRIMVIDAMIGVPTWQYRRV